MPVQICNNNKVKYIVILVSVITLLVAFADIIFESRGIPRYLNVENAPPLVAKKSSTDYWIIYNHRKLARWLANKGRSFVEKFRPWHLRPYFYHNRTFWPWITGIEILARNRFKRFDECNTLLSKLASEDKLHILTFYEWVNPKTGQGGGAYPFRTGVCTVRMAIDHILSDIEQIKYKSQNDKRLVLPLHHIGNNCLFVDSDLYHCR
jgi:hypothetical protein